MLHAWLCAVGVRASDKRESLPTAAVVPVVPNPGNETFAFHAAALTIYVSASAVPCHVPDEMVPTVERFAEPAHVESAVFSTALRPTSDLVGVDHANTPDPLLRSQPVEAVSPAKAVKSESKG